MAGFLDSKERVIDMQLTGLGRKLLSEGELRFVYWTVSDDEVDYNPTTNVTASAYSGSVSGTDQIASYVKMKTEDPLVREATNGYVTHNRAFRDQTNLVRPLFTVSPGQQNVPKATVEVNGTASVYIQQREILDVYVRKNSLGEVIDSQEPVSVGVERFNASSFDAIAQYTTRSFSSDHSLEGFYVKVLVLTSSSETPSYQEQWHALDEDSNLVYGSDVLVNPYSPGG